VFFDKRFAAEFASWRAASDTVGGRFPGGQSGLFQGLWTDPVTGIAFARARWYDARNASWLSEDPLLDVDSPNLYAFVGHAPNMYADPLGLERTGEYEARQRAAAAREQALQAEIRQGETFAQVYMAAAYANARGATPEHRRQLFAAELGNKFGSSRGAELTDQLLGPAGTCESRACTFSNQLSSRLQEPGEWLKLGLEIELILFSGPGGGGGRAIGLGLSDDLAREAAIVGPELAAIEAAVPATVVTPWGTKEVATGKFFSGARGGIDPVDDFIAQAEANGFEVIGREVTFHTPFGQRHVDVLLRNLSNPSQIGGVELKSSLEAFERLEPQQFAADRYINMFGARATGEKAAELGVVRLDSTVKILWPPPAAP
jgi:RHS repeat-associated protein